MLDKRELEAIHMVLKDAMMSAEYDGDMEIEILLALTSVDKALKELEDV